MTAAVVEVHSRASQVKTTLNMSFRTDYLTMVLYSPGPEQVSCGGEENTFLLDESYIVSVY